MRRRLLGITLATTTLVVIAFVVPLAGLVRSVARDRAVSGAERDATSLAPSLASADETAFLQSAIDRTQTGADGRLTVWLPDGTQLGDGTPADANAVALARQEQASFSQRSADGLELYAPVVTGDDATSVIRARLPDELLHRGVTKAWTALAAVGLALVLAAAAIADRLVRSLTSESTALAGTARTLAAGDPDARVTPGRTPELADAARALNLLADRIDELRSVERARVADLSHRLRTPLTALRLDAEAAGNDDVSAGVDRLEAAVTELIRAAQRPLHAGAVRSHCDLAAVVRERADFWGALADDDQRSRRLDVRVEGPVEVALSADELGAAIDALLGNVFQHTPDGTAYAVTLTTGPGTAGDSGSGPATDSGSGPAGDLSLGGRTVARLRVDDAGPGIPDAEVAVARGEASGPGSGRSTGLGLDIARRAAESAGGALAIGRSDLGGTRVTLTLPT